MSISGKKTDGQKKVVLCGICGGIAAYKAADVVSSLMKLGVDVHVIMSKGAQEFITPLTFQALTGKEVTVEMFADPSSSKKTQIYPHLYPSLEADLFVMLPATAAMLSNVARGEAEDVMTASVLGLPPDCIRVFCPAMNTNMWQQTAVQENVRKLENQGWIRFGPGTGLLACKSEGEGRMSEPNEIVKQINHLLETRKSLAGKRVLILSGPTREHIDPVRFISNPSSGKMGKALAEEAARRGATVDFVTGPVDPLYYPAGQEIHVYPTVSAEDMLTRADGLFEKADILIFAAAVADYTPMKTEDEKLPKKDGDLQMMLRATEDIAQKLCQKKKPNQIAIGFALQDQNGEKKARVKLAKKGLDAIVLNELDAAHADEAVYRFLQKNQKNDDFDSWGVLTKADCAQKIFNSILKK